MYVIDGEVVPFDAQKGARPRVDVRTPYVVRVISRIRSICKIDQLLYWLSRQALAAGQSIHDGWPFAAARPTGDEVVDGLADLFIGSRARTLSWLAVAAATFLLAVACHLITQGS